MHSRVNRSTRLCFAAVCAAFLLAACARERDLPRLQGWQYAVTAPRDTPPGEDAGWREEVSRDGVRDFWMRAPIPAATPPGAHLVFRAYVAELTLFVDGRPVHHFRDASSAG